MLISELAKEVHQNAVAHGWWDEKREAPEINALIHSEWSEALEEARAGRPLAYIVVDTSTCPQIGTHYVILERSANGKYMLLGNEYHGKPEGVAVELIDGCIRILDYIGKLNEDSNSIIADVEIEKLYSDDFQALPCSTSALPELVAYLHLYTAQTLLIKPECHGLVDVLSLSQTMTAALTWVKHQGLDPLAILMEKHEYNKTRPYKHGKKF